MGYIPIAGDRKRKAANFALQWRPDDTSELYFEGFVTDYKNVFELDFLVGLPWLGNGDLSATVFPGTNQLKTLTNHNVFTIMSTQANDQHSNTNQFSAGGYKALGRLQGVDRPVGDQLVLQVRKPDHGRLDHRAAGAGRHQPRRHRPAELRQPGLRHQEPGRLQYRELVRQLRQADRQLGRLARRRRLHRSVRRVHPRDQRRRPLCRPQRRVQPVVRRRGLSVHPHLGQLPARPERRVRADGQRRPRLHHHPVVHAQRLVPAEQHRQGAGPDGAALRPQRHQRRDVRPAQRPGHGQAPDRPGHVLLRRREDLCRLCPDPRSAATWAACPGAASWACAWSHRADPGRQQRRHRLADPGLHADHQEELVGRPAAQREPEVQPAAGPGRPPVAGPHGHPPRLRPAQPGRLAVDRGVQHHLPVGLGRQSEPQAGDLRQPRHLAGMVLRGRRLPDGWPTSTATSTAMSRPPRPTR
jgi:hypothetical protein